MVRVRAIMRRVRTRKSGTRVGIWDMCVPSAMVYHCCSSLRQVDWQLAEFCYSPIIQSRSTTPGYDLKFTAESTSDPIAHKGVLLVAVGMRYKGHCSNVGRTFIVDPTKVCPFLCQFAIFTDPLGNVPRSRRQYTDAPVRAHRFYE